MLSECAKPRVLAGTSGLLHQPCPEPAPSTPEKVDQTAVVTPTLSRYSSPPHKTKGLMLHKIMVYVSGDAHLSQAYPVILELLCVLMHFPLEAASHPSGFGSPGMLLWEEDSRTGKASSWYTGICCPWFHPWQTSTISCSTISLSLDKGSESKCLKLALKMKTYMPFSFWDLEEGWARV